MVKLRLQRNKAQLIMVGLIPANYYYGQGTQNSDTRVSGDYGVIVAPGSFLEGRGPVIGSIQ